MNINVSSGNGWTGCIKCELVMQRHAASCLCQSLGAQIRKTSPPRHIHSVRSFQPSTILDRKKVTWAALTPVFISLAQKETLRPAHCGMSAPITFLPHSICSICPRISSPSWHFANVPPVLTGKRNGCSPARVSPAEVKGPAAAVASLSARVSRWSPEKRGEDRGVLSCAARGGHAGSLQFNVARSAPGASSDTARCRSAATSAETWRNAWHLSTARNLLLHLLFYSIFSLHLSGVGWMSKRGHLIKVKFRYNKYKSEPI